MCGRTRKADYNQSSCRPTPAYTLQIMSSVFIYQILNHYTKREDLDPGFLVLDNSANERPDWFEYGPIRRFLLNEPLDKESFYGFLSPKFKHKTNMSSSAVYEFVGRETEKTDVVLLSQSVHLPAYFLNTFQYGDSLHPGLLDVANQFFERIGRATDLNVLITTSQNEVYSNYFIAKPSFWREWLSVTEQLFSIAESPTDPLGARLRAATAYRNKHNVPMKIFIVERIATWILAREPRFVARARDPFVARSRIYKLPGAIACDALKLSYLATGKQEYIDLFRFFSKFGRFLSWQIKIGSLLGSEVIRSCLKTLSSYWVKAGQA
jgi:hypothetical protein